MNLKRDLKAALLVVVLVVVCGVGYLTFSEREYRAGGRVLLRPESVRDPLWLAHRFDEMTNLLTTASAKEQIALKSKVDVSQVRFVTIRPVRGTMFVEAIYVGANTNDVLSVASNAGSVLVNFYRTNATPMFATNYGAYSITAPSAWDSVERRIRSLLP